VTADAFIRRYTRHTFIRRYTRHTFIRRYIHPSTMLHVGIYNDSSTMPHSCILVRKHVKYAKWESRHCMSQKTRDCMSQKGRDCMSQKAVYLLLSQPTWPMSFTHWIAHHFSSIHNVDTFGYACTPHEKLLGILRVSNPVTRKDLADRTRGGSGTNPK